MKRELRMIVGSIAFAVLSIPTMAFAAPWPITPHSKLVYGPGPWGLNTFCGVQFDGSFSAAYFSQAQSWVNYGGNCNAQWGRPANTLRSRVRAWDDVSGTLTQTTR